MYMNQPLTDILTLDIIEAQLLINAYGKIINPPNKRNKKAPNN